MNSKILNEILHGQLRPWLPFAVDDQRLKELIRIASKLPSATTDEIHKKLATLLQDFPGTLASISDSVKNATNQPPHYTSPLPEPANVQQHFYKAIIDADLALYFAATINNPNITDPKLDVPYQIGQKSLKGIATTINKLNNDLVEESLDLTGNIIASNTHFVLLYMRNSLLSLYFSIQERFQEYLPDVYDTIDDFYLFFIDNSSDKIELTRILEQNSLSYQGTRQKLRSKLSFGCNLKREQLRPIINMLCDEIDLLNSDLTTADDLLDILFAKDITPGEKTIKLRCDNKQFRWVIEKLKIHFDNLSYINIEKTQSFYSRDNDKPFLANDFSKAKSSNPKQKEIIDRIFQQLQ